MAVRKKRKRKVKSIPIKLRIDKAMRPVETDIVDVQVERNPS